MGCPSAVPVLTVRIAVTLGSDDAKLRLTLTVCAVGTATTDGDDDTT